MKKLLLITLFCAVFLIGCEKNAQEIASEEVFEMTDGVTYDGVKIGDGKAEFINAYNPYVIQTAYTDTASNYRVMSIRKIPYDENISTLVATFFIDGKPISEEEICRQNEIEEEDLPSLLSSPAYLQKHNVIYRYLRFNWEDSEIMSIDSSELNFNEAYEVPCLE